MDEPSYKATISSAMIVDKHLTCLGNSDIASEETMDDKTNRVGKKKVTFNKMPPMSTYLITFVVGELNYAESNEFTVPIRVYALADRNLEHGRFALETAVQCMKHLERTFDIPYPLPKLDLFALPRASGALENWGCISLGETFLFMDPDDATTLTKQTAVEVIAHELSHQWFGNLVTVEWWDAIWPNEGFAEWVSHYIVSQIYPEWDAWADWFATNPASSIQKYQMALITDSNRSSHPVHDPGASPENNERVFNAAISYLKRAAILKIISKYLSIDVFIDGLRLYLRQHAFGNSTTDELFDALGSVSGKI